MTGVVTEILTWCQQENPVAASVLPIFVNDFNGTQMNPSSKPAGAVTPEQAEQLSRDGEALLIDIRGPDEWAQSGIAETAIPISVHEPGFVEKLNEAMGGDTSRATMLICATGGRTSAVVRQLRQMGYDGIIDVPEGMFGNAYGPGWVGAGLPVKPYKSE